jgi:protein SCO1/2
MNTLSVKTQIVLVSSLLLLASVNGFSVTVANGPCASCNDIAAKTNGNRDAVPAALTKDSIYQLDARFTNDSGLPFAIGTLRGRPVVLDMFFTSCGYACPLTVKDMLAIQKRLPRALQSTAIFVLVSFDSVHDTPPVLARFRSERSLNGQWILLHGDDAGVRELAALLGVKYKQDSSGAFSHSNILTVLDAQGQIAYQRTGLNGGIDAVVAATVQTSR